MLQHSYGIQTTFRSQFSVSSIMWVPGDWTQVISLRGKFPYLLSHFANPTS